MPNTVCETCGASTHDTKDHNRTSATSIFPRVGVATFVVQGTKILLGRSDKLGGKIVIPGGGVKPFESVNDAARREILEETGVHVLADDILFVSEVVKPPYEHRIVIYMMGHAVAGADGNADGEIVLKAGDDLSEVFWADTRELDKYQDEMTELTVDAICKFAIAVRSRGMTRRAS